MDRAKGRLIYLGGALVALVCLVLLWALQRKLPAAKEEVRPTVQISGTTVPGEEIPKEEALLPSLRDMDAIFHVAGSQLAETSNYLRKRGVLNTGSGAPEMEVQAANALGFDEVIRKALNKSLAAAFRNIQLLQRKHVEIVGQTENSLTLRIPPFPEGSIERDRLRVEMEALLGRESGDSLWELALPILEKEFRHFGTVERKLEGRTTPDGYNEVTEDGITTGFPFPISFDAMQANLFKFEDSPADK